VIILFGITVWVVPESVDGRLRGLVPGDGELEGGWRLRVFRFDCHLLLLCAAWRVGRDFGLVSGAL
jgi:hypothetical protein